MRKPRTAQVTIGVSLLLSALVTTSVLVGAGPLDPPPGPVGPTGVTLSDISTDIADIQSNLGVLKLPLSVVSTGQGTVVLSPGSNVTMLTETVIVERVTFASQWNAYIQVRDGNGTPLGVGRRFDINHTATIDLGVLAENGVVIHHMVPPSTQTNNGWFQIYVYYREIE